MPERSPNIRLHLTSWPAQAGRRQNLQSKQVTLALAPPAGVASSSFRPSDVAEFLSAADTADHATLELAWEIVTEECDRSSSGSGQQEVGVLSPSPSSSSSSSSSTLLAPSRTNRTLPEMSMLLFDSQDARSLYIMHRMLTTDRLYFKQVGNCSTWRLWLERHDPFEHWNPLPSQSPIVDVALIQVGKGQGLAATFEARTADQVSCICWRLGGIKRMSAQLGIRTLYTP